MLQPSTWSNISQDTGYSDKMSLVAILTPSTKIPRHDHPIQCPSKLTPSGSSISHLHPHEG